MMVSSAGAGITSYSYEYNTGNGLSCLGADMISTTLGGILFYDHTDNKIGSMHLYDFQVSGQQGYVIRNQYDYVTSVPFTAIAGYYHDDGYLDDGWYFFGSGTDFASITYGNQVGFMMHHSLTSADENTCQGGTLDIGSVITTTYTQNTFVSSSLTLADQNWDYHSGNAI
jgi:hypothetical protein